MKKISILHCKIAFFEYLVAPENAYPTVCPKIDIHFGEKENMPKISILQCKMVFFAKMVAAGNAYRHKFAPGVEIFIAAIWKICKTSPFYTVKWRKNGP